MHVVAAIEASEQPEVWVYKEPAVSSEKMKKLEILHNKGELQT